MSKNGYLSLAFRQLHQGGLFSRLGIFLLCMLTGVFSFGLHRILLSLDISFLQNHFSYLVQRDSFAVGITYGMIVSLLLMVCIIVKFDTVTFREIGGNRWYMLNKVGYRSTSICVRKMAAYYLTLILFYTVGFAVAVGFAALFHYPMIPGQIHAVYLAGILKLLGITAFLMMFSLWGGTRRSAAAAAALYIAGNLMLKTLGYGKLMSDTSNITDASYLFRGQGNWYYTILSALVFLFILIPFLHALSVPVHYRPRTGSQKSEYCKDYRTDAIRYYAGYGKRKWTRPVAAAINLILILILLGGIFLNLLAMAGDQSAGRGGHSMFGVIPYINRTETPEPLEKGELALFRETEGGYPVQKGDIVLLRTENGTSVKKIESVILGGLYVVSADGSPATTREVGRDAVAGVLIGSYDRLGALSLFSVTLGGRAALLLAPLCLIILLGAIKRRPD